MTSSENQENPENPDYETLYKSLKEEYDQNK